MYLITILTFLRPQVRVWCHSGLGTCHQLLNGSFILDDNEDDEYDDNREEKFLRRKNRNDKDRPLPPLLARVGGSIEVSLG